jgi:hypothetical protein
MRPMSTRRRVLGVAEADERCRVLRCVGRSAMADELLISVKGPGCLAAPKGKVLVHSE